jgi:hypothetical protein
MHGSIALFPQIYTTISQQKLKILPDVVAHGYNPSYMGD